jgi:hypothetical protein
MTLTDAVGEISQITSLLFSPSPLLLFSPSPLPFSPLRPLFYGELEVGSKRALAREQMTRFIDI